MKHVGRSAAPSGRPLVLLCTSNGVGLGHVTRMMALSEALQPRTDVVMFTLSAALPIPIETGITVEHLASAQHYGASAGQWHDLLAERLDRLIDAYRPSALVFDGVHPYAGLREAVHYRRRNLVSIWVRRGMWKSDVSVDAAAFARLGKPFDHIVEPGDYAASYDHGITARHRDGVRSLSPIVYAQPTPRPLREQACADLGLRADETNVLVQLGAGQINDIRSTVGAVSAALGRHHGVTAAVGRSVLSAGSADLGSRVVEVQRFPITHWINAFDAAVVAAGYNSFHEMLSLQIPTIIVPNLNTKTDDQDARSRWAHDQGVGLRWDGQSATDLESAIATIVDPVQRAAFRQRMAALPSANGAPELADLVCGWLR